jgi:peptide/nickel transport system permease protein
MTRYIIRRSIQSFALLWVSTIIAFSIYQLAPGGPLQFLEQDPNRNVENIARLERSYGIDRSIPVQYIAWAFGEDWLPRTDEWRSGRCLVDEGDCTLGIVRLDFGRSFSFRGERVFDLIVQRIPATFTLAFAGLVLSVLIGFPLGIIAAFNRARWPDNLIRVSTVLINTVPEWWIGLLLLIILGAYLGWVPLGGMYDIEDRSLLNRLHHLLLPALVSSIGGWIGFSRILRFEILDVLNQDYIRTARAKGLSRTTIIWSHVLRNAIMPFVTGLSGIFLLILSGAILFELVFSWPGMGRLTYNAINSRDYPMMMALFVVSSFLGILGTLMVDILYSVVDPRVRYDKHVG